MSENDEREDAMKQRTGRESGILHIPEENTKKKKVISNTQKYIWRNHLTWLKMYIWRLNADISRKKINHKRNTLDKLKHIGCK